MTTNQPPLTGIKVVDMSTMISGPLTAMMLADYGADDIKIESPGQGDLMRYLGTQKNGLDRKSTRLNSSHVSESRMPSSA